MFIYTVVLISAVCQSDSVTHRHVFIFFSVTAYHWMLNVVPCAERWDLAVRPSHIYFEKTILSGWRHSAPRVPILPRHVGATLSQLFCGCCPIPKSCLTPCGPTDPSRPGLPVQHHLTSRFIHTNLQGGKKRWEEWDQGRPLYKNKSKAKLWIPTQHPSRENCPSFCKPSGTPKVMLESITALSCLGCRCSTSFWRVLLPAPWDIWPGLKTVLVVTLGWGVGGVVPSPWG